MAKIYPQAFFGGAIIPLEQANVSVASSAVLYGLSIYTVLPVCVNGETRYAFRIAEHWERLVNSAKIIGLDMPDWNQERFESAVRELIHANDPKEDVFVRVSLHATALVPGVRSRGVATDLSIFLYEAASILPKDGARLKTSVWRRVPDFSIPSRAKVNGAYVNSVLAKQDALDSGYDDCLFLDVSGHVCELSAANIFIVRNGTLITPGFSNDILEGINRRTILELASDMGLKTEEREIDLTELYIADEAFACGTSAFITPILEIDKRKIGNGELGALTAQLQKTYFDTLHGREPRYMRFLTEI